MSAILQLCQYTNLRGFSPMVQYAGYVHLGINSKKNPALKIFTVSNDSTQFLTYCTLFRICTFRNQQTNIKKIQLWNFFQFLQFVQFCQSIILHSFSTMVHLEINKYNQLLWKLTNSIFVKSTNQCQSIFFTYCYIFTICILGMSIMQLHANPDS